MAIRDLSIALGGADSVVKYDVSGISHEERSKINSLCAIGVVLSVGAFHVVFCGTNVTPRLPQNPPTLQQEIV